ncbi:MAG: nucleoid-associated protein [Halanaerobiales bacterium]|nr:nucleoid-associated protein [Halanaerobiales bacterium]
MFDFKSVKLEQIVIHKVGNKQRNEGVIISNGLARLNNDATRVLLLKYFLSSFKSDMLYKFYHETDIHLNELYMYLSKIFLERGNFYDQSVNILKHLYEKSTHPQIKNGEFYMVYLSNCLLDGEPTDAIGIFKSENKELYLKVTQAERNFNVNHEEGINIKKLDKGCLIFNSASSDGYKICIVDAVTKNADEEALYWKEEFLRVTEVQDHAFHTKTYLGLCKNFCEDIYGTLHQADKKEQAVFLNNAISYFSTNEEFDMDRFSNEVLVDTNCIEDFKSYKQDYDEANDLNVNEKFKISDRAVKSMKRKFKNLIKLDTEIEIKIKNSPEGDNSKFIERGYDPEKQMHFYKIYFNEEQ